MEAIESPGLACRLSTLMAKRRSREVFSGAVAGADAAVVFVPGLVEHVVAAVLDGPVAAVVAQHGVGAGLLGVQLVTPWAASVLRLPDFFSMTSRSIRKTCPTWGKAA